MIISIKRKGVEWQNIVIIRIVIMNKPVSISTCIVLYQQDIIVLENAILHFKEAAIYASEIVNAQFILFLVDNASGDKFTDAVDDLLENLDIGPISLKFIKNNINSGYSGGNNLLLSEINTDYHIVMNPDVYVEQNTFVEAINYMQKNDDVGLLTPAIYGLDHKQVYLCKKNPTLFDMFLRSYSPKFIKNIYKKRMDEFEMRDRNYEDEIIDVSFPSGCFMFFRANVFKLLKGFDTRFFLYMEDADIGRRVLEHTHSAYVPTVKVTHLWARGSHNDFRLMLETIKSAFIYWRKWGGLY